MPLYRRYIILHLLAPLLVTILTLTCIVWAVRSMRFIDLIVNNGIPVSDFLYLTSLLAPMFIIILLPIATLIAILHTYNKLTNDRELIVLNSAGLSTLSLASPGLIVAILVTVIGYFMSLYVSPTAYREFKNLQYFSRNSSTLSLLQEGVFNTPINGLTVYIESHSSDGMLQGILVHDRNREKPITVIAQEGQLIHNKDGFYLDVINGQQESETEDGNIEVLYFDSYSMDLSTYSKDNSLRPLEPEERYLGDLLSSHPDLDSIKQARLTVEGHQRLIWPLLSITISMVALACLLSGQFDRRGQWQRILVSVVLSIFIVVLNFITKNLSIAHPHIILATYANALIPMCIAFSILKKGHTFQIKKTFRGTSPASPMS
jgi:lipopolysaccharide export system permease protein